MVVGDLGPGLGGHGQEGGFPHVGEAHQAHVGQELQLQDHRPLLPRQAGFGELGGLPGGGGKVLVPPAAVAPPAEDEGLVPRHVLDDLPGLRIPHHGAPGDLEDQGAAVLAGALLAGAVAAVFGHVLPLVPEVHEGGHTVVHLEDHVASPAAVPAVGAAGGHVFLPVKGHAPFPPAPERTRIRAVSMNVFAMGYLQKREFFPGACPWKKRWDVRFPPGGRETAARLLRGVLVRKKPRTAPGLVAQGITPQRPPRWKPACGPCPAAQT